MDTPVADEQGSRVNAGSSEKRWKLGDFEFDGVALELSRDGEPVVLQPLPARALAALLEKSPQVVTHDELRQRLWPDDVHIDHEHGVHSCIAQIRTALGESGNHPRFVQTLARRGYRLVGAQSLSSGTEGLVELARPGRGLPSRFHRAAMVIFAVVLVGWLATSLAMPGGIRDGAADQPGEARAEGVLHAALARSALESLDAGVAGYQQAVALATEALARDPVNVEALVVRGMAHYRLFAWQRAKDDLTAALKLAPTTTEAQLTLGEILVATGRFDEGLKLVGGDQTEHGALLTRAWLLHFARRYEAAVAAAGLAVRADPKHSGAYYVMLFTEIARGNTLEAAAVARQRMQLAGVPVSASPLSPAAATAELAAFWRGTLDWIGRRRSDPGVEVCPVEDAIPHLMLRQHEAALDALERGFEQHCGWMLPFIAVAPAFDSLRGRERFELLVRRLELDREGLAAR